MPRKPRKPKPRKPSFTERAAERVETIVGLGRLLVNEPKRFPTAVLKLAKGWFRALWAARGGGLYACGFVLTFVWLELQSLVAEIVNADVGSFILSQTIQAVMKFSLQSLENTVLAFVWPILVLQAFQAVGLVALAALFFVFPRHIKPHLTRWLFDQEESATEAATVTETASASNSGPATEE